MARQLASIASMLLLTGCATTGAGADSLAGSTWRLIELQSSDDTIGVVRPDDPAKYEMSLGADGRASLRLDCNRGSGTWQSTSPSQISFSPLAMTRAMCPPGSLDTRVARELSYVRTYVLEGDRLTLNLMADGGNLVWVRSGE